ncbi:Adenosyl-chloride synthase [Pseudobythopirellula maris]|uniref:Adenosyl-chloride synthase n=1 Tax=Pseudobythopirellula maris TaxID=2527991 RepID=A0A5C5ZRK4_9BACT|nr:SAM-dependent chlorinase/fluorinase [Pseudobythopirellula maris]TWT89688.1 Adenosyl-chloride synthase [Pseudobythopirellula maris]
MPLITLTTDFGAGGRYVAQMKGVICSLCPEATVVDLSHAMPPQGVAAAARFLEETTLWFPAGAVHLAVVDPGVGTDRAIVAVETADGTRYVAPDNGLLAWLAKTGGPLTMVRIEEAEYRRPRVSATFHGRDIMAPAAAHLAGGLAIAKLGPVADGLAPLSEQLTQGEAGVAERHENPQGGGMITGQVVEIDSFGNLITDIGAELLGGLPEGEALTIECDEHKTFGLQKTYGDQPPMTLVALVGSGDKLELAIVDDSAQIMLGVKPGAPVTLKW